MKAIIVDDEIIARKIIIKLSETIDEVTIVNDFSNALDALKYLNKNEDVDLVFLDIHMPNFTGFDFIETLKTPPAIILTTSDVSVAIDAFEYDAIIDFLAKPIQKDRLIKALNKVEKSLKNKRTQLQTNTVVTDIFINIDKTLIKLDVNSIYLIEAQKDYINIKTDKKDYRVHTTLKKIEEKLPKHLFVKIHRSFIINFKRIIDIQDYSVLIEKNVVPISRSNRPILMKKLNLL